MEKIRLDTLLVQRGFAPTRQKAKAIIMSGVVLIDEKPHTKAGENVDTQANIRIKGDVCPYVSRGGLKLKKALDVFNIDLTAAICADIGASTGGFTDCMLQHNASKVYAIDVGYGQLNWSLRNDERVVIMERTNARYLDEHSLPSPIDFISVDVSFISLNLLFGAIAALSHPATRMVTLIKPQFEAGKEKVGKKGVVKDPNVHIQVLQNVISGAQKHGLNPIALEFSPITGPNGNIEYLLYYENAQQSQIDVQAMVALAFDTLT